MVGTASIEQPGEDTEERRNAVVQFYRYVFGIGHDRNVGGTERLLRYTLGALFTVAGLGTVGFPISGSASANVVLALVLIVGGLYLIYEAQVQYCPLNQTIGRSTYSKE